MLNRFLMIGCVGLLFSGMTMAESLNSYMSQMVATCINDGEQKAVCQCAVDQWSRSDAASNKDSALTFAKAVATNTPPSPQQMASLQAHMMAYQQAGMNCAMTAYQEEESSVDMADYIPGLSKEQADAMNGMANGSMSGKDYMKELERMDQERDEARALKREQQEAERQKEQAARQKRQAIHDKEMAKLEARRPISSIPYQDMKAYFYTYYAISETPKSEVDCLWGAVSSVATNDGAGSWLVWDSFYGGDYDHPADYRQYREKVWQLSEIYQPKKNACFE